MKKQKILFMLNILIVVIGCFLPIYKLDDIYVRCSIFTAVAFIFNCFVAIYLYYKRYVKLIIVPQIISAVYFIIIWADITDKFAIMEDLEISYRYCIGFYLILIGVFSIIVQNILYIRKNLQKEIVKVKYTANKKTGCIEKTIVKH